MREHFRRLIDHMAQRFAKLAIDRALEMCAEVERDQRLMMTQLPDVIEPPKMRQLELWTN